MKSSLFADDMLLRVESLKDSTQKQTLPKKQKTKNKTVKTNK